MPFALQGAPATFQRLMDGVIPGLGEYSADDLIVFSHSWTEHLSHLRSVFERLRAAGLTAKAKKCQLGMSQCVYLGHIVGNGKVSPETSKLEAETSTSISGSYWILPAITDLTKNTEPNTVKY